MKSGPQTVVVRLYDALSGPADLERDWDEVRSLFLPDAILLSELTLPDLTLQSGSWTLDEFCEAAAQEYRKTGFWEQEVWSRTEEFGCIAHIWSTYESRINTSTSDPVGRGINSVQLLQRDGRWLIASLVFQIERGTDGVPLHYLPTRDGTNESRTS